MLRVILFMTFMRSNLNSLLLLLSILLFSYRIKRCHSLLQNDNWNLISINYNKQITWSSYSKVLYKLELNQNYNVFLILVLYTQLLLEHDNEAFWKINDVQHVYLQYDGAIHQLLIHKIDQPKI